MPTVIDVLVKITREASEAIERSAAAMPEEKLNWRPMEVGRSALDQVVECGGLSHFTARMLRERAVPQFDPEALQRMKAEHDTLDKARTLLHSGVDDFIAAVREFPEAQLEETLYLPFAGGMTRSFLDIMYYPYWNMSYHLGQINYIQTLYGDRDMH